MTNQSRFRSPSVANRYPAWLILTWGLCATLLPWLVEPAASWRDGPEFVVAAWGLGISHPAGFPLYAALAWAAEQFPLADIVMRNHAFSALLTLVSGVLLYEAALSFLACLKRNETIARHERGLAGWVSICWMLMPPQIENAIQSEAYSLFAAFAFLICILLFDFLRTRDIRRYVLAVFLAGLGCGNHAMLGVFLLPFIIAIGVHTHLRQAWKTAASGLLAGTWGLMVYLYLPLRSRNEPSLDWGNAETWQGFWRQVLDEKDASTHFSTVGHTVSDAIFAQTAVLGDWLGLAGLLLIACGWIWVMIRHFRLAWVSLSGALFLFVFFIDWTSGTVLTAAFGIILLGAMTALKMILDLTYARFRRAGLTAAAMLAAMVFLSLYQNALHFVAGKAAYLPSELVRTQLLNLPYRATVLAGPSWFHLLGLQNLEGLRPDVTVIGLGDVISPQYFRPLRPRHIPLLKYPQTALPLNGAPSVAVKTRFLRELLSGNTDRSRFYLDMDEDYLHVFIHYLAPSGAFWWAPLSSRVVHNDCRTLQSAFSDSLSAMLAEKKTISDPEFGQFLQHGYFSWFKLATNRQPQCVHTAEGMLKWWLHWMRGTALKPGVLENDMGVVFARIGHARGARVMFQLAEHAHNDDGAHNLALWLLRHGERKKALRHFRETFLRYGDTRSFIAYRNMIHAETGASPHIVRRRTSDG